MPTLLPKEFMGELHRFGAAVHSLPPTPITTTIERYFTGISKACYSTTDDAGNEPTNRTASAATQIDALIQKGPRTALMIYRALPTLSQTAIDRYLLKAVAGGKMLLLEGNKYSWVTGANTEKKVERRGRKPRTAKAATSSTSTNGSRLLSYIAANPGCTKAQLTQALPDVRSNHLAIALNRLFRGGKISSQDGPYVVMQENQRAAA